MTKSVSLRLLILGNSGCGKSTLAKRLSAEHACAHLDLDTLAWQATTPPERMPLAQSSQTIAAFVARHEAWIIEGCYTDLLDLVAEQANILVLLDLSVLDCQNNARARPWEPHKYASKAEQDQNLDMLLEWIAQYTRRADTFSKSAHDTFYADFRGQKVRVPSNSRSAAFQLPVSG